MLTSKQRAEFRAQANSLETTLMVGKDGVTEAVVAEADKLLTARELVKGKVLETALMSARPPVPTAFPASVPSSSSGGSAKNVRPSATRPAVPNTRRLPSPRLTR